jgi:hypothetical protein
VTPITAPGYLFSLPFSPVTFLPNDLAKLRQARLPFRFRIGAFSREYSGETMGISPELLIMRTSAELQVGLRLQIHVLIPVEVSGQPFSEISASGRVISVSQLPDGMFGYQVEFESNP